MEIGDLYMSPYGRGERNELFFEHRAGVLCLSWFPSIPQSIIMEYVPTRNI